MRSFAFKIIQILPIIAAIVAFNYFSDPFLILNTNKQNEIVNYFLEGKAVAFATGYNGYVLKRKYIEQQKTPIELIVLGSSRSNQIGHELFKESAFFNACLDGSKVNDMLGMWQLIEEEGHHPKKVILELNSQVLQIRHSRNRKWLTPLSNKMLEKLNYNELIENDPISIRIKMRLRALLSIQYGLNGFNKEMYKVWTPKDSLAQNIVFADGSTMARDHSANVKIPRKERFERMFKLEQFEMQPQAEEVYVEFIRYLQNLGVEVILFIPPANPIVYKNKTVREMEKEFELFIQKIRLKGEIKIVGSLNPENFNLTSKDFTDDIHFKRSAMKIIFDKKESSN